MIAVEAAPILTVEEATKDVRIGYTQGRIPESEAVRRLAELGYSHQVARTIVTNWNYF